MAKADRSIDPRILTSAKQEFLAMGFEKASLKKICENAGVTTGALYKRYQGKDDLFCAVVSETIEKMNAILAEKTTVPLTELSDEALIKAWDMDEDYMMWWFRFLYENYDGFVLLLKCAEGTSYSNFLQEEWVETMTGATYDYYLEARRRGLTSADIPKAEMHILLSAFWTTIYEPFIHNFTWEEIKTHSNLMCDLFNWYRVLGFSESASE